MAFNYEQHKLKRDRLYSSSKFRDPSIIENFVLLKSDDKVLNKFGRIKNYSYIY